MWCGETQTLYTRAHVAEEGKRYIYAVLILAARQEINQLQWETREINIKAPSKRKKFHVEENRKINFKCT